MNAGTTGDLIYSSEAVVRRVRCRRKRNSKNMPGLLGVGQGHTWTKDAIWWGSSRRQLKLSWVRHGRQGSNCSRAGDVTPLHWLTPRDCSPLMLLKACAHKQPTFAPNNELQDKPKHVQCCTEVCWCGAVSICLLHSCTRCPSRSSCYCRTLPQSMCIWVSIRSWLQPALLFSPSKRDLSQSNYVIRLCNRQHTDRSELCLATQSIQTDNWAAMQWAGVGSCDCGRQPSCGKFER